MKRYTLLVAGIVLFSNSLMAQFYFRAGAGYAFPQAGQSIDGTSTPYSGTRSGTTYSTAFSVKNASLSSGVQGAIGCGYMFSDHIGVELSAVVGLANTKYTFTDNNVNYGGYQSTENNIVQANDPIIVSPSLVLQTGGSSPWNAYTRWGLALPLNSRIAYEQVYYIASQAVTDDYIFGVKSSFSLGVTAAAGLQYTINDRMTVWGELSVLSMSLYIKEMDLQSVSENGQGVSLASVGGPHTVKYSKNATVDTNYTQLPTYSQPFSNIGLSFGISMRLSEKHSRKSEMTTDDKKYFRRKR